MSKLYKIITDIKKLEDELEKSWKKAQVGEVRTRQDGKKYKKVSDTGNKNQDWKLVSDTKGKQDGSDKSPKQRGDGTSEGKKKLSNKELNEAAKNASETALNNAIKQSGDPLVRETAHQELKRREEEEKPQEESKEKPTQTEEKEDKDGKSQQESKKEPETKEKPTIKDKLKELANKWDKINSGLSSVNNSKEERLEFRRYIKRVSEFKNVDKEEEIQELSNLLDLKSEEEVKDFFGDGDILGVRVEGEEVFILSEDAYIHRTFDKESGEVMMDEFILNPDLEKGKGVGFKIFSNQVDSLKNKGFKKLITRAERSSFYNGYYTWARLGYSMDDFKVSNYVTTKEFETLDDEIKNSKSLNELMSTENGRKFWKEKGQGFYGEFDLNSDSDSMKTLNKYKEEKNNDKRKNA